MVEVASICAQARIYDRLDEIKSLVPDDSGLDQVEPFMAPLVTISAFEKVEMLFAHLKRILKLDRLRLRGPNGAKDEFHLAAAAQNLRKMAKMVPIRGLAPA